jgi:NTP pyrophosphatase (non-canonical NTP hydrolase)
MAQEFNAALMDASNAGDGSVSALVAATVAALLRKVDWLQSVADVRGEHTVRTLVAKCHEAAKAKGWHEGADPDDPRQVLAWMALIHSEVSEAVEDVRTRRMEATTRADGKPEGFETELADIAIRVFDVAGALGIDLEAAIVNKMRFNESRPHRHGGKAA